MTRSRPLTLNPNQVGIKCRGSFIGNYKTQTNLYQQYVLLPVGSFGQTLFPHFDFRQKPSKGFHNRDDNSSGARGNKGPGGSARYLPNPQAGSQTPNVLKTRSELLLKSPQTVDRYLESQTSEREPKTKCGDGSAKDGQESVTASLGNVETLIADPPGALRAPDAVGFSNHVVPGNLDEILEGHSPIAVGSTCRCWLRVLGSLSSRSMASLDGFDTSILTEVH